MEYPLLSVIVPVYKVEAYLEACIASIEQQTYPNWELILVDDGSPDSCGAICDRAAAADTRIAVLHKPNGGLSDARNRGIELAKGDYAAFVDSDDYLAPNYLQYLYDIMTSNGAQGACCNAFWTESRNVDFAKQSPETVRCMTAREVITALTEDDYLQLVTAWGKLFPMKAVRKFPFPTGKKVEDEGTTYKLLYACEKMAVSNQKLYGYFQNPKGLMHQVDEKHLRDSEEALRLRYEYFAACGEAELSHRMEAIYYNTLIAWAAKGNAFGKQVLAGISLQRMLRLRVRLLYRVNFLAWKLLHRDFITFLDGVRAGHEG